MSEDSSLESIISFHRVVMGLDSDCQDGGKYFYPLSHLVNPKVGRGAEREREREGGRKGKRISKCLLFNF